MSRKKQWDHSPDYLTAWEFAKLTNCCEATVLRLLRKGELEGFRMGSHWRLPISQLQSSKGALASHEGRSGDE
jgi:excisionase family DNA binding protein